MPSREVAARLFNAYLASVHPSFPIIGISTFISQYQLFFNQPSVKPGNKWLAILNLIFAIAAKYSHISRADWRDNEDDHLLYFARARMLSMNDQLFDHPDLQQIQVEGLASFYLLATDQINRYVQHELLSPD
jgi:Fungal specific transcription factor domain.